MHNPISRGSIETVAMKQIENDYLLVDGHDWDNYELEKLEKSKNMRKAADKIMNNRKYSQGDYIYEILDIEYIDYGDEGGSIIAQCCACIENGDHSSKTINLSCQRCNDNYCDVHEFSLIAVSCTQYTSEYSCNIHHKIVNLSVNTIIQTCRNCFHSK